MGFLIGGQSRDRARAYLINAARISAAAGGATDPNPL